MPVLQAAAPSLPPGARSAYHPPELAIHHTQSRGGPQKQYIQQQGAVQATLLAQQDAVTPLVAVATQCVLNIGGDWLLVVRNGGGLAGAAWATVLSQVLQ